MSETTPAGPEIPLTQARHKVGDYAIDADRADQVTYLTRHGRRLAAVVPAEAARTRSQLAAEAEARAQELDGLRQRLAGLEERFGRRETRLDLDWATHLLALHELLLRVITAAGQPGVDLGAQLTMRLAHAREIVALAEAENAVRAPAHNAHNAP